MPLWPLPIDLDRATDQKLPVSCPHPIVREAVGATLTRCTAQHNDPRPPGQRASPANDRPESQQFHAFRSASAGDRVVGDR